MSDFNLNFNFFQIYLCEMKIEQVKEQQKEFEKNSTELLEKLKKISDKREKCEVAAKDLSSELEAVSSSELSLHCFLRYTQPSMSKLGQNIY